MQESLTSSQLPDLLPKNVKHMTLHFSATRRLLSPLNSHVAGATLDQIIPEFGAVETVIRALQRHELDCYVQEPVQRTDPTGALRVYRACLHTVALPVANEAGELAVDVEDITELHLLRRDFRHLQQQLHHQQAMVDMVAHDLNTPLTTLQGYLELTALELQAGHDATIHEYLRIMQNCVERIVFTVGEMYDVVSMEVGQLRLRLKSTPVVELLQRAVQENRFYVERRQQMLEVHVDDDLPEVECDELRMLQVLQNLISNASKYSSSHTPIRLIANREPGQASVRITVSDRGRGIDAAHLPFVFERAYRVQDVDNHIKGAGLGLFLARMLVEVHGGDIWCDSVVGQGSNFHFTLPVAPPPIKRPTLTNRSRHR